MATRTIETKAIISAEDKTGNAFSAVVQKLAKMESAAKAAKVQIGATDRAAAQASRMAVSHAREEAKYRQEIQHHGIRRYVAQTAATAVAAHSVVETIRDSYKAGASYQHEVTALQNAGRNAEEMKEITAAARDAVKQIPTSTYTENLKVINETTSAFGSLNHAIENLPFMQKSASVLQSAMPAGQHVDAADLGNKMARVFEERGTAGNPEVFRKEASEAMRAMVFSGGKFNPDQFLGFAQQAKSSLQNYDLRFLTRIAPSLIGTQGGDRAGTAANAFTGTVMGKANDAKQAAEWMKYGLLDPKQTINKSGKTVAWRAGAVKDTNLALSNPLEWAEKVALPAMKAKGVNVDDRMELTKVLGTMFRNQNANMFANEIMQAQQRSRLHKDEGMIDKAGTLDDIYKRNLSQDPTASMTAMTASLENFMTVLSKAAMPSIASGLTSLATGIEAISSALHDHPLVATGGGAVAAGAGLYASGKAAYNLSNGFGLSTSAVALDGSAAALDAAAVRLGVAGGASTAEHAADKILAGGTGAAEAGSLVKTGGKAAGILGLSTLGSVGVVAGAGAAAGAGLIYGSLAWKQAHPEEFHARAQHAYGMDGPKPEPEKIFVSHPRRGSSGDWVDNPKFKPPQPSLASQFTPIGSGFNPANPFGKGAAAPPQKVDVTIEPPAPVKMTFEVVPSSVLLQIVESAKTASLQIKAHADTGPGGLGETHTGQH